MIRKICKGQLTEALGFTKTGEKQEKNGIVFVPFVYKMENERLL